MGDHTDVSKKAAANAGHFRNTRKTTRRAWPAFRTLRSARMYALEVAVVERTYRSRFIFD
jgi:hypothetical protein